MGIYPSQQYHQNQTPAPPMLVNQNILSYSQGPQINLNRNRNSPQPNLNNEIQENRFNRGGLGYTNQEYMDKILKSKRMNG